MLKLLVMYSNQLPSQEHIRHLRKLSADVQVVVADSEDAALRHAADAEVILGHRYLRQTLPHTRCLRWVQSTGAGVQHLLSPALLRVSPILTRCPIFSHVVAFHAFTLALAMLRRIPDVVQFQHRGNWASTVVREGKQETRGDPFDMLPLPKTALVLGMGQVGRAIATILRQNGITVLGVARKPSPEVEAACDEVLDNTNWRRHLHRADLCFIALPLVKSTVNLFNGTALKALPRHAVLVDVGRGGILDVDALVRQLESGHLGGAALDVLDPRPETRTDPIWTTPRLLITPHVAVFYAERQNKLEEYIEGQVKRYLDDEELQHKVDIEKLAKDVYGDEPNPDHTTRILA